MLVIVNSRTTRVVYATNQPALARFYLREHPGCYVR